MFKIFLSYSHNDLDLKAKFYAHLKLFADRKNCSIWVDNDIVAGEDWQPAIMQNLEASQIIILLISIDFLNSKFCMTREMQSALDLHASKRAVVIPVNLRAIPDYEFPFNGIQALPRPAPDGPNKGVRAITAWPDFDLACIDVCKGIEEAIDNAKEGLLKDLNHCDIDSRKKRIEGIIEDGDLPKAGDLLMEFCSDFSPDNQDFKKRGTKIKSTLGFLMRPGQRPTIDELGAIIDMMQDLMEDVRREPLKQAA